MTVMMMATICTKHVAVSKTKKKRRGQSSQPKNRNKTEKKKGVGG
jgi:hypothetical protein